MTSAEQVIQSVEDTIVENGDITGYNLLIQMAGKMNDMTDAIPVLRQSLQEEEKMFTWLRANAPAMFAKLWPQIEESLSSSTTTSSSSSAYKEQTSKTNTTTNAAATESIPPEVFDSSTYDSMTEIKKSATLNESETNKVFLDTEKKEPIRPEMTNIKPKNKNNTSVSNATASTTAVNPTMEWRASALKQSREKEKEESVADKTKAKQK